MNYTAREFEKSMWDDLVELFGPDGASDGCWCMSWRSKEELKDEQAKNALHELVNDGKVNGIIAYDADTPIGWTTFGQRESFPNADKHPDFKHLSSSVVSIPCFFVKLPYRGKGVSKLLLSDAIKAAKRAGIQELEAYPVKNEESPETKQDWSFTGAKANFEDAGFSEACGCKYELQCMRLKL